MGRRSPSLTGRKGFTSATSAAIAVRGYVLYTLSDTTDSLEALTWVSPWRWHIADAMLINGLDWDVLLPFGLAIIGLLVGWPAFTPQRPPPVTHGEKRPAPSVETARRVVRTGTVLGCRRGQNCSYVSVPTDTLWTGASSG